MKLPIKQTWILIFLILNTLACSNGSNTPAPKAPPPRTPELKINSDFDCRRQMPARSGIIGGKEVKTQNPLSRMAVLLTIDKGTRRVTCSAVAISSRILLTAAHCTHDADKNTIAAIVHPDMRCSSGYSRGKVITSVDFVRHESVDLALVKLASPVPKSYVMPLYSGSNELPGEEVLMLGYGVTSVEASDQKVLRTTSKNILKDVYFHQGDIRFDQKDGGLCDGDSGSPLYVTNENNTYQVAGIASKVIDMASRESCRGTAAGVFIPPHLPWIREQIKNLNQKP